MTKGNNGGGDSKVAIDRFWLSIGIPVAIWVFSAGIGWNKLSYAEESIKDLKQDVKVVDTIKFDTVTRLVALEQRIGELTRNVDKLIQLQQERKPTAGPHHSPQ